MNARWPSRLAWLGAVFGLFAALLLFAPARWLAQSITSATDGQLQLVNARGTVWRGQADVLLTGGQGSQTQTSLPQGLQWRLSPTLVSGMPSMALLLSAPCCTPQPVDITLIPRFGGAELRLAASNSRWPAELLTGLGTPWNTLRMQGLLVLQTDGLTLRWDSGRLQLQGQGQWVGGRLRFQGVAEAAPDSEAALNNLLNIIGRRQGPRSLLNIG